MGRDDRKAEMKKGRPDTRDDLYKSYLIGLVSEY
jgi:hypothetical protein